MPTNNHEDQTLRYERTDSTSTGDEESDDAENQQLIPSEENKKTTRKDKKVSKQQICRPHKTKQ